MTVSAPDAPPATRPDERPRRSWTTVAAVVVGLVVGIAAAVVGPQLLGGSDEPVDGARIAPGEISGPDDLLPDDVPVPAGAGASSPQAAAMGFLDAEVAGDFERSFGYLSDAERVQYGTPAGWVSAHADVVPPILGYELGEQISDDADQPVFAAEVRFAPGLDRVVGLTPATATVQLVVVDGAQGWGVSLQSSPIQPTYPSDDGVVPAAQRWVDTRRECTVPSNEHGGLVGSPALAETLCDSPALEVGPAAPLEAAAAQPVFNAFGAEAVSAARVVRVSGAAELGIVLVPVGDEWIVIGVLP